MLERLSYHGDMKKSRKPRDPNQAAFAIVQEAVSEKPAEESASDKNPNAVALGRLGGLKGGKARAEALSARKRKEIARKAARKRWEKTGKH